MTIAVDWDFLKASNQIKKPTTAGILTFMSRMNFLLIGVEHEKSSITSGPGETPKLPHTTELADLSLFRVKLSV